VLTIDSREAKAHPVLLTQLNRLFGQENITVNGAIDFGDYIFRGAENHPKLGRAPTVAIELCSVSDLLGKVSSGRLIFQLSGLIDRYDVRILMVESPIQVDRAGRVYLPGVPTPPYERVADILFAAQCHGVIVEYAANRDEVPYRINQNYKYWNKPYDEHQGFRPAQLSYDTLIPLGEALDARVSNLMTLPGVGEKKAADALEMYKSLGLLYQLPPSALRLVPGWGPVGAQAVYDFIHTNMDTGEIPDDIDD